MTSYMPPAIRRELERLRLPLTPTHIRRAYQSWASRQSNLALVRTILQVNRAAFADLPSRTSASLREACRRLLISSSFPNAGSGRKSPVAPSRARSA